MTVEIVGITNSGCSHKELPMGEIWSLSIKEKEKIFGKIEKEKNLWENRKRWLGGGGGDLERNRSLLFLLWIKLAELTKRCLLVASLSTHGSNRVKTIYSLSYSN